MNPTACTQTPNYVPPKDWKDYYETFHLGEGGNDLIITYEYWMRLLERQLEKKARKEKDCDGCFQVVLGKEKSCPVHG